MGGKPEVKLLQAQNQDDLPLHTTINYLHCSVLRLVRYRPLTIVLEVFTVENTTGTSATSRQSS